MDSVAAAVYYCRRFVILAFLTVDAAAFSFLVDLIIKNCIDIWRNFR